jgi:hypothetical protein
MVRSGFGLRSEGGGGEGGSVAEVDKGSVKLCKDRLLLTIGPGVSTAKKGDFHQTEKTNGAVEGIDQRVVDVIVVFLIRVADEIEVADDNPRANNGRGKVNELLEERARVLMVGGAINIGDLNGEIRNGAG